MTEVKETKAQRAERLKREKNPWEALDEIRAFARSGRASVDPEWLSSYFRWWGIYTQGDGLGATGGKGGEGNATEYFMMRITSHPMESATSDRCGTIADLRAPGVEQTIWRTSRSGKVFKYHWLTVESLPEVIDSAHGDRALAHAELAATWCAT